MINWEKIDKLINNNKLEEFKKEFFSTTINTHHRNLLLEKTMKSGHGELIKFMMTKTNCSSEMMINFFLLCLENEIPKENLIFFNDLNDMKLMEKMERFHIEQLIKKQPENIYDWFLEKYPLTAFKNFSPIYINSFKYNKEHYLKPFESTAFNYKTCYNFALCAFEHERTDILESFLIAQVKFNPQSLVKMKEHQQELYDDYVLQQKKLAAYMAAYHAAMMAKNPNLANVPTPKQPKKPAKPELVNEFINEHVGRAFHQYLNDQLTDEKITKKKNKI